MALEPDWQLCGDWGECDLKHPTGLRIQVKQSAARQSWHRPADPASRGRFAIGYKTGRFEDDGRWTTERSRNADIFVMAWHPRIDAQADHRSPDQWRFFVILEANLPKQESISLTRLCQHAEGCGIEQLQASITTQVLALTSKP